MWKSVVIAGNPCDQICDFRLHVAGCGDEGLLNLPPGAVSVPDRCFRPLSWAYAGISPTETTEEPNFSAFNIGSIGIEPTLFTQRASAIYVRRVDLAKSKVLKRAFFSTRLRHSALGWSARDH